LKDFHYWLGYGPKMWIALFATWLVLVPAYWLHTRRKNERCGLEADQIAQAGAA